MQKKLIFILLVSLINVPLLRAHDASEGVQVEVLEKGSQSWDGSELPEYPEGKPEVTLLRITIPPHTKLPLHHHPVINVGLLTKGELTVITPEGDRLELKAGDSLVELVGRVHYGMNESDEPSEIVVFYAGVAGEAITVKEED